MARFIHLTLADSGHTVHVNADAIGYFMAPPEGIKTKAGADISFINDLDRVVRVLETPVTVLNQIRYADEL